MNWTFVWKLGKQLSTTKHGKTTITNSYDVDGKTVEITATDGNVTKTIREYVTLNGKIVR